MNFFIVIAESFQILSFILSSSITLFGILRLWRRLVFVNNEKINLISLHLTLLHLQSLFNLKLLNLIHMFIFKSSLFGCTSSLAPATDWLCLTQLIIFLFFSQMLQLNLWNHLPLFNFFYLILVNTYLHI